MKRVGKAIILRTKSGWCKEYWVDKGERQIILPVRPQHKPMWCEHAQVDTPDHSGFKQAIFEPRGEVLAHLYEVWEEI